MTSNESTYAKDVCNYCMKAVGRDNLRSCSQCRFVRYCSRRCQRSAWSTHKKACKTGSELREGLSSDREAYSMNERLSKWVNTWRESLCKWSIWGLNVNASAKDKLSTHCFVLHLDYRPDASSPAQFFRMRHGEVVPRTRVLEMFREADVSQKNIDEWLADERGDHTVQIVIFAEDFLRFLWFSIRDIRERQGKESDSIADALASGWSDALRDAVEEGNTHADDEFLRRVVIENMMMKDGLPGARQLEAR